jgi:ribosomal protein L29
MATHLSTTELRNMQMDDLRKEITAKRMTVAKMHIDIEMRSEKDSARFLREKKELARMLTIENEKQKMETEPQTTLKTSRKTSTVSASAKAKTQKSATTSA